MTFDKQFLVSKQINNHSILVFFSFLLKAIICPFKFLSLLLLNPRPFDILLSVSCSVNLLVFIIYSTNEYIDTFIYKLYFAFRLVKIKKQCRCCDGEETLILNINTKQSSHSFLLLLYLYKVFCTRCYFDK